MANAHKHSLHPTTIFTSPHLFVWPCYTHSQYHQWLHSAHQEGAPDDACPSPATTSPSMSRTSCCLFVVGGVALHSRTRRPAATPQSRNLQLYHPQLSYCMALFASKHHVLTQPVPTTLPATCTSVTSNPPPPPAAQIIGAILKYWPLGDSNKCIMLLNELQDIFDYVEPDDSQYIGVPVMRLLHKALGGDHFQVAERALCIWHSPKFMSLMITQPEMAEATLPIVFTTLYHVADTHWHEYVVHTHTAVCLCLASALTPSTVVDICAVAWRPWLHMCCRCIKRLYVCHPVKLCSHAPSLTRIDLLAPCRVLTYTKPVWCSLKPSLTWERAPRVACP